MGGGQEIKGNRQRIRALLSNATVVSAISLVGFVWPYLRDGYGVNVCSCVCVLCEKAGLCAHLTGSFLFKSVWR